MEITYKGIIYEMDKDFWGETSLNDSVEFQYLQLKSCIKDKDFLTLQNRLVGMVMWGGIKIKKQLWKINM